MTRSLRVPLLVGLVFFGPLLLAVLVYFGPFRPDALDQVPNPDRELISPPAPVPTSPEAPGGRRLGEDWARYRWSLIYARISPCDGQCARDLERLTQVYIALGRDTDRVQRVYLASGGAALPDDDPELIVGRLDGEPGAALVRWLGRERLGRGRFFVVDPLGNLVASYPPDADQARLLKDLKRLLGVSRVG
jgi:hypothetical protein